LTSNIRSIGGECKPLLVVRDQPPDQPMEPSGESQEIRRLRGALARAETQSAYVAARVAVEAGRLADAVAAYLAAPDADQSDLHAALNRWQQHERSRKQT
jgi:hypothetical protein